MAYVETTMVLSASGYTTPPHALNHVRRAAVKVVVPDGDSRGNMHLVTRVSPNAGWDRDATNTKAKSSDSGWSWRFDLPEICGHQIAIEWERTSGGTDQAASVYMTLDKG